MNEFSNAVILPQQLPPLQDESFNGLDRKLLVLKHLTSGTIIAILTVFIVVLKLHVLQEMPLITFSLFPLFGIFLIAIRTVIVGKAFPRKGYLLRERDISFRRGWLFFKLTTVPFNRIQHVEVSQSFLEKGFGLATLKVYTAGGSVSDLSIPGLVPAVAHKMESFLLQNISDDE